MSGDQSQPDPPEATGAASAAVPAARWLGVEHASALVAAWTAVGRWAAVAGGVAEAALLLAARMWLSQTIFVHQIMMMMHHHHDLMDENCLAEPHARRQEEGGFSDASCHCGPASD